MTLGDSPAERFELNPDAPFPPFPLWLRVPADWSQVDTHPATWRRSADRLIDNTFRGTALAARDRRAVLAVLEELVADCQRAGAALSLLTLGRLKNGEVASAGVHLAFATDAGPANLGRVRDMVPRTGTCTTVDATVGPAVLHRDRMTMTVPGTTTVTALTSLQLFLPFPDTCWTGVLSTASPVPELTGPLEQLLRTMGESIRLTERAAGVGPVDTAADGAAADDAPQDYVPQDYVPTAAPRLPGIERGFGTLVVRRLGSNQPRGADR